MAGEMILVVDDNEDCRMALKTFLEASGYLVAEAADGEEAVERARETDPDLILLDIMMPGVDGLEAARRIRGASDVDGVMIVAIMISAVDDLDSVVKCIELGAEDYLFKPFNPVLLKARVGATIDKYRAQQSEGGAIQPVLANSLQQIEALLAGQDGALAAEQEARLTRIAADLRGLLDSL